MYVATNNRAKIMNARVHVDEPTGYNPEIRIHSDNHYLAFSYYEWNALVRAVDLAMQKPHSGTDLDKAVLVK